MKGARIRTGSQESVKDLLNDHILAKEDAKFEIEFENERQDTILYRIHLLHARKGEKEE